MNLVPTLCETIKFVFSDLIDILLLTGDLGRERTTQDR